MPAGSVNPGRLGLPTPDDPGRQSLAPGGGSRNNLGNLREYNPFSSQFDSMNEERP